MGAGYADAMTESESPKPRRRGRARAEPAPFTHRNWQAFERRERL